MISHSVTFKRGTETVDAVEAAMAEALAQGGPVSHPAIDKLTTGRIRVSHQRLVRQAGDGGSALTVLLPGPQAAAVGAIVFERETGTPFGQPTLALAVAIAGLVGPMIGLQLRGHRWVAGRLVDATARGLTAVTGPRRPALKLAVAVAVVALAGLACADGTHRVSARAVLEGEVQRAAVAPFDGFVLHAPARAGDEVRAGQLLAAMDDRELILERVKAGAERDKLGIR